MLIPCTRVLAAALLAGGAAACSGAADSAPPVATPTVTVNRTTVGLGSPVEITYRFAVASDAPMFDDEYWVFVHFLSSDGELMWTDDHQPPTPVRQWKPGATVEYTRLMFVPKFPYVGQAQMRIGLYSPTTGERLPLAGPTEGQRAYDVASFDMRLESEDYLVAFEDGWHRRETPPGGDPLGWQWSMGTATLVFPNPGRDARLYLQIDQPIVELEPQQVELRIGDAVVDSFTLTPGVIDVRQVAIPAAQLGTSDTVELTLSVDKTFVPALIPALNSADPRNLGIRAFYAFVEPS